MGLGWRKVSVEAPAPAPYRDIGHVRHAPSRVPADWAAIDSELALSDDCVPALRGLADYSHIWVLFALHEVGDDGRDVRTQSPPAAPGEIGVFALRTQARPNPIGMTVVRLRGIDGATVRVRGLDALEGTPVLDIKPYIPYYDSVPDARAPAWIGQP
ncbi:MAG: tRNA (N6-threonylcarbamoyladenosine(37)-N6)-methyltransferase TrmO [Dehalococcoidia bacterium]|nr:tRNA (N6-threonylcarbamoyladenosine(37)-N6)-methyltransferase TrmO [Dehalococcoidia bacterium]